MTSSRKMRFEIEPKQKKMFLIEMQYIPKSQVLEDLRLYFEYSLGDTFKKMSMTEKTKKINSAFRKLSKTKSKKSLSSSSL